MVPPESLRTVDFSLGEAFRYGVAKPHLAGAAVIQRDCLRLPKVKTKKRATSQRVFRFFYLKFQYKPKTTEGGTMYSFLFKAFGGCGGLFSKSPPHRVPEARPRVRGAFFLKMLSAAHSVRLPTDKSAETKNIPAAHLLLFYSKLLGGIWGSPFHRKGFPISRPASFTFYQNQPITVRMRRKRRARTTQRALKAMTRQKRERRRRLKRPSAEVTAGERPSAPVMPAKTASRKR